MSADSRIERPLGGERMILDGKFSVAAPVERVWRFILDVPGVSRCLPGCESVEAAANGKYLAVISARVGPIHARVHATTGLGEMDPLKRLSIRGEGKDALTASPVRAKLELALAALSPQETEISYRADVFVGGRLGQFGDGILRETANVIIQGFIPNFKARLEGQGDAAGKPPALNLMGLLLRALAGWIGRGLRRWASLFRSRLVGTSGRPGGRQVGFKVCQRGDYAGF